LTGKYWFPKDRPHVDPVTGKVTLLWLTSKGNGLMDSQMAMLQRLYKKYHDKGLEIVLILKTEGYSWSSPPQSAEDEAKTDAWYYLDHLQLPFTVMVDETPFTTRPDGRREPGQIAFQHTYPLTRVLIGRDGRIYTLWMGLESESQMNAFIQQALEQKSTASANK
jgi:glutathione peroxidase-family protein